MFALSLRVKRIVCGLFLLTLLGVFWGGAAYTRAAPVSTTVPTCVQETLPVALAPDQSAIYHIVGWLCWSGTLQTRTVQVLVSGGSYDHTYWDFPTQPDQYSYLRYAANAGYAVFNFDRIGQGHSDHPLAELVTVQSNAYVIHQIILALRAGQFSGVAFQNVILAGHSLGSGITIYEASQYPGDVNGVIITGFLHTFNSEMLAVLGSNIHPTLLDPRFAPLHYPGGYLTTKSGMRGELFYYQPTADPAIIDSDEATKGTFTDAEASTFFSQVPLTISQQIHVPVLIAVGQYDQFFCEGSLLFTCADPATVMAYEAHYYSPDAHLQITIIPNSGHDLNLQENASTWFTQALAWANQAVGM